MNPCLTSPKQSPTFCGQMSTNPKTKAPSTGARRGKTRHANPATTSTPDRISKRGRRNEGGPRLWNTPQECQKAVDGYFAYCDTKVHHMTVVRDVKIKGKWEKAPVEIDIIKPEPYAWIRLCSHVGSTRETVNQYLKKPLFSDILTRARERCEGDHVMRLFNKDEQKGAEFLLAAKYGYTTKTEQKITGGVSLHLDASEAKMIGVKLNGTGGHAEGK